MITERETRVIYLKQSTYQTPQTATYSPHLIVPSDRPIGSLYVSGELPPYLSPKQT